MERQRIKTNIIELDKLHETPWQEWLKRFKDGKLDAHEDFKKYGEKYWWLYENSDYDLIGWEIDNGVFDWKKYSWVVAKYCPEHLDPEKYNWLVHSSYVARYCPYKLDPKRYNWERSSWAVLAYCPEKIDPERFNWADLSSAIDILYKEAKIDIENFLL